LKTLKPWSRNSKNKSKPSMPKSPTYRDLRDN
jgi:hypothetical protein